MTDCVTELMNDGGVFRTAPATPGLLKENMYDNVYDPQGIKASVCIQYSHLKVYLIKCHYKTHSVNNLLPDMGNISN